MPFKYEHRKINREQEVLVGADCDGCGVVLEPVMSSEDGDCYGFKSALRVTISGGYGEYIDGGGSVILCQTCAFGLEGVQSLTAAFQEARD